MPISSVKRIIEMPLQVMTSQALFQAFGPRSPDPLCLPQSPSVCPWVFLFLAHTSWTVVVVVK